MKVLFLGKAGDARCGRALDLCRRAWTQVDACLGDWGDPLPRRAREWRGDLLLSYLSRWVVPGDLLARARMAALNFHPAPPEYPGTGCINFALYEAATRFGVTCHHMAAQVDSGALVAVRRFPVLPGDDLGSLLERSHDQLLALFQEIVGGLADGRPLPASAERWRRPPFTRRQLDALARIEPDMDAAEIARRIRATTFGRWRPWVEIHGFRFEYRPPAEEARPTPP